MAGLFSQAQATRARAPPEDSDSDWSDEDCEERKQES